MVRHGSALNLSASDATDRELGPPPRDPFTDALVLFDATFIGLTYDAGWRRLALLFLLDWDASARESIGSIGLLVFADVGEFAWKVRTWPVPAIDWTSVMDNGLNAEDGPGLRAQFALAGAGPGTPGPPYRFSMGLLPDHALTVAFTSASYYVGSQPVGDGQDPIVTFTADAQWTGSSRWPR